MERRDLFQKVENFSLVLGGPLYQLLRRLRLLRPPLGLLQRRTLFFVLLTWFPLLVLTAIEGHLLPGSASVPFLIDAEVHARFLLALPLLIVAEVAIHRRLRPAVGQFLQRAIIPPAEWTRFDAIVVSSRRWRDSTAAETGLILFILFSNQFFSQYFGSLGALSAKETTWYASMRDSSLQVTLAGYWFGFLSKPLFQFWLLRWYFRLLIWGRFLWQVSRLNLHLVPTHPDRAGGLAFLGIATQGFVPILAAQGILLAGVYANRIFLQGASLAAAKVDIAVMVVVLVLLVLAPLIVFTPKLLRTKRTGLREYGTLASRYVREFDRKWVRGGAPREEHLLGNGDIQSLADLANSFDVVRAMRLVPFGKDAVLLLILATALPLVPLVLTIVPLDELVVRLAKILL